MHAVMPALLALAGLLAPAVALAHGEPHSGAPHWTWDAWVTVPLAVSLAWFALGYARLRTRSMRATRLHRRRAAWFLLGWTVLALAVVSPLHAAGERSFAAHMLEHELLMLVAAPLLVLARPIGWMLWALPHRWRRALGAAGTSRPWQAVWGFLSGATVATVLQAVALWGWHAPPAFDLALKDSGWHIAQHVSFLVTALLFWWAMLRGTRVGLAVGCLFATSIISGALGALMAFSESAWYDGYASLGLDAFGLDPVQDQQLAGLLMWVPGGLVHAAAGVALLARMLRDRPTTVRRATTSLLCIGCLVPLAIVHAETVYVSDEEADVVHVIRVPTWDRLDAIPVGARPRGIALDASGKRLYVAVSDDNRVDVVDVATGTVVGQVPSGPDPERFALLPDGRTIAIANEDDALVSFVDLASGKLLAEVPVGAEPEGIAASPDGRWVICTSETASLVHFIDARTHEVIDNVPVGTRPRDVVFSRDGRWLWASSEVRATVAVFDMRTRKIVRTIDFDRDEDAPVGVQAVGIALSGDGQRAYVALGRGNQVAEVDATDGRILRYFPVGQRTWGVGLSPDGKRVYAAAGLSGDVTVIELASGTTRTLKTGGKPWGVAVLP